MNIELFKTELAAVVKKKVAQLKRDGVVAMGPDNLWQVCVSEVSKLPNAPVGTNAAWVARQAFNEVVLAKNSKFLIR